MKIEVATVGQALAGSALTLVVLDNQLRLAAMEPADSSLGRSWGDEAGPHLPELAAAWGDTTLVDDVAAVRRGAVAHERRETLKTGEYRRRISPPVAGSGQAGGVTIIFERLDSHQARGERVGRAVDRYWFDALHEMQTPLAAMGLWQKLLEPEMEGVSAEAATGLNHIMHSVGELSAVLDERSRVLRRLSRTADLKIKRASWRDCVRGAVERVRPVARAKGVALHVTTEPDGKAAFDAEQMAWVLQVLLENAVKFTPTDGSVKVTLRRRDGQIMITVADTGVGLAAGAVARVFEPGAGVGEPGTQDGAGVNLAAGRCVVEAHGGSLAVESAGVGRGCSFCLRVSA